MHKLETLILNDTKITPKAFEYLINLKNLKIANQSNIPAILLSLHNIEFLELSCFQIYRINQKLCHLTTLKKLILSGCYNDYFDGSCFKYLVNLSELILINNNVISDEHLIYNKHLEKLSLKCDNKITGACFSKLPKLRHLDISHCKQIKDKYLIITKTLESFTYEDSSSIKFNTYKLNCNVFKNMNLIQLTIIDDYMITKKSIFQSIRHMTNLKYITCIGIPNNNITYDYIKSILPDVKQIRINQKYRVY